jgi:hypothetical protein
VVHVAGGADDEMLHTGSPFGAAGGESCGEGLNTEARRHGEAG